MKARLTVIFTMFIGFLNAQHNTSYLQFENYDDIAFPVNELKDYFGERVRFFEKDTIGQNYLYPGECLSSSSRLYKFLIDKDVISGYVDIYEKENIPKDEHYIDKREYILQLEDSLKIYYLGELVQDDPHKTYLFSTYRNSLSSKSRKEFQINLKNGVLQSILLLTEHYLSDFGHKRYTIYLGNGKYIHGIKTLYSDVIGIKHEEENPIRFSIDTNGFILEE